IDIRRSSRVGYKFKIRCRGIPMLSINTGFLNLNGAIRAVLGAAALSAAPLAQSQLATAAEPETLAAGATLGEVVVTGTRVVRDGYEAPTPVSVVTTEELQSFASPNIADGLNTLPSLAGSWTPAANQVN